VEHRAPFFKGKFLARREIRRAETGILPGSNVPVFPGGNARSATNPPISRLDQ
jgi:hypothetical protein